MIRPRRNGEYEVVVSGSFDQQWDDAIANGWMNPVAHPAVFIHLRTQILANRPWVGQPVPGMPENFRYIRFPRITDNLPMVEVRYSIVEGDLKVYLEAVVKVETSDT